MEYSDLNSQTIEGKYKPLSPWAYFGYSLLFGIPLVGFVFLIMFALSDENINRRNFARSTLLAIVVICPIIVVIIVLSATVIFTGLSTPDAANFAHFCQDVDNVYSGVLNSFADLKVQYANRKEERTDEQLYMEVASGFDPGEFGSMDNNCENIDTENTLLNMKLPKVREHDEAWYVTKDGRVFNATGYVYNHDGSDRTYFNITYYKEGNLKASSGKQESLAAQIADTMVNSFDYEIK